MLFSRTPQIQAYFPLVGLTLVRGLSYLTRNNVSCSPLSKRVLKVYQCLYSCFLSDPSFSLSDAGGIQQSEDKVSLCLCLHCVCRYNPVVVEGLIRRCRCLGKLSKCLNLLCPVRVTTLQPEKGNKMLGLNSANTVGLGNNVHRCCLLWHGPQSCPNNRYIGGAC